MTLYLSAVDQIPSEWVDDFERDVSEAGLEPIVETRPAEPLAGVVWLLSSGIVLFIASKYFGALAAEAGKDHYPPLKRAVVRLADRVFELPFKWMTSGGAPKKLPEERPGPLTMAIGPYPQHAMRFVFPEDTAHASEALDDFFRIVENATRLAALEQRHLEVIEGARGWRVVLRHFGPSDGWQFYDPLSGRTWPIETGAPSGTKSQ